MYYIPFHFFFFRQASQTAPSSKNGHLNEQQRENLHEILAKQLSESLGEYFVETINNAKSFLHLYRSQNIEALIKDLQILKKDVGV